MQTTIVNQTTGEERLASLGWSWPNTFLSFCFLEWIYCFMRGFHGRGLIGLSLWIGWIIIYSTGGLGHLERNGIEGFAGYVAFCVFYAFIIIGFGFYNSATINKADVDRMIEGKAWQYKGAAT